MFDVPVKETYQDIQPGSFQVLQVTECYRGMACEVEEGYKRLAI